MITRNLRPKYSIEQYPVVFTFPGDVLGTPSVEVTIVTGVDPAVGTFAGAPTTFGPLVSVVVIGGVPGNVYEVSCSALVGDDVVVQVGRIGVVPTAAEDPPGETPIPFSQVATTPPYPYITNEALTSLGLSISGKLVDLFIEEATVLGIAIDGDLRDILQVYSLFDEAIVLGVGINGDLHDTIIPYSATSEAIVVGISINGNLQDTIIQYLNGIEEATAVGIAINGNLT